MAECINKKTRTARKKHFCQFCWEPIEVGEKYEDSTCVGDNGIYSWKMHCCCSELAYLLDMYSYADDGVTDEQFSETIQEYVGLFHNINVGKDNEDVDPKWVKPLNILSEMIVKEIKEHPEVIELWEKYNSKPWEFVRYEQDENGNFIKK